MAVTVSKIAPGVWSAGTRYVNWYVVDAGVDGLTVIDAGLPRYTRMLDGVLAKLGRKRADVRAVLLTHGHIDHVGMAHALSQAGASVHLHPDDVELAADPRANQTERNPLAYLYWPGIFAFFVHLVAEGGLRPAPMPVSQALVDRAVVDVCQGSREFPRCDHGNSSPCGVAGEGRSERVEGVAVAAHAVAVAGNGEHAGVVEQAIEDGGRDGGVFEDLSPVGDPAVGGQDDAAVFVAAADDLEEV